MIASTVLASTICVAIASGAFATGEPIPGIMSDGSLAAPTLVPNAAFGTAMSGDGELLCIGAPVPSSLLFAAGTAYLFRRNSANQWLNVQLLQSAMPSGFDRFGISVALGSGRLVVGAAGPIQGTASIYTIASDGVATPEAVLTGAGAFDEFGTAVALGTDRIAVGSPRRDIVAVDQGSVRVFRLTDAGWDLEAELVAPSPSAGDRFGSSVAMNPSGSILLAGAPATSVAGLMSAGSVFAYARTGRTWTLTQTLVAPIPQASASFGASVALRNDGERLAIGAPQGGLAPLVGRAWIWQSNDLNWIDPILAEGDAVQGRFGTALAWRGDVLAVGAPGASTVRLFAVSATEWKSAGRIVGALGSEFGAALATPNGAIASGAPKQGFTANSGEGRVFVRTIGDVAGDCDSDGVLNGDEVVFGAEDCNANLVPDDCDLATLDCDGDHLVDSCATETVARFPGGGVDGLIGLQPFPSYECVFLHRFEVAANETGVVDALAVQFKKFKPDSTYRVALWSDPDGDGVPTDAALVFESPVLPIGAPADQRFALPGVAMGGPGTRFFAGVAWTVPSGGATPALARCAPPFEASTSFFATGTIPLDLGSLSSAVALGPIEWLFRGATPGNPRIGIAFRAAPDLDGNLVPDVCQCAADLDGNGIVNAADLATLLGAWGPVAPRGAAVGDLDGDGVVGATDLGVLLGAWGACVPTMPP